MIRTATCLAVAPLLLAACGAQAQVAAKSLVAAQVLGPAVSGTGAIGDRFGRTLSWSGDTLVVGAIGDELGSATLPNGLNSGSVSVYREAGDAWALEATLLPSVSSGDDRFGFALAVSGDVVVVGAPFEDAEGQEDRGAVYVYQRSGAQWQQVARLLAPDGEATDLFGHALALDADGLAIGSPRALGGQGKAYHYVRSGAGFTLAATLVSGSEGDEAGRAISLTPDAVFVGAPARTIGGAAEAGSVYCFARADGSACATPVLAAAAPSERARYGAALAAQGNRLLVGAPGESGVVLRQGSVHVYDAGATVPALLRERLFAPDAVPDDAFGSSLAIDVNTVAVGAPGALRAEGAAFVFIDTGASHALQQSFSEPDGGLLDLYGASLALHGDSLAVGIELDNIAPNRAQGSVVTYARNGTQWSEAARISTGDGASREQFGESVALDGSLAVVGSPLDDPAIDFDDAGTATVFRQDGSAWVREARLQAEDAFTQDLFGFAVDASGDRVVVGAPSAIVDGMIDRGAAYVFRREGGAWVQEAKLVAPDGGGDDLFGLAVAIDGDTIVVGAPFHSDDLSEQGAGYAYRRDGATWAFEAKLATPAFVEFGVAGLGVALDGDVAVLGAPDTTIGESQFQGAVHVFARGAGGWSSSGMVVAPDGSAGDSFGSAVALDGPELLVGAAQDVEAGLAAAGSAYLYAGTPGAFSFVRRIAAPDPTAGALFGSAVALSSGRALVGCLGADAGATNTGAAYLYERGAGTWPHLQTLGAAVPQAQGLFGAAVALGPVHALVGEPLRDRDNPNEGAARVYTDDDRLFLDGYE